MSIKDEEYSYSGEVNPVGKAAEVTPTDTNLSQITRAIYIGGGGDLRVMMAADNAIVWHRNLAAGMYYPLRVKQIMTGTTATDIVAWF